MRARTLWLPAVLMSIVVLTARMHCAHSGMPRTDGCRLDAELCKLVSRWKSDVGGCQHIRTFTMAKSIVDILPGNLRNLDSIRYYLGPADRSNAGTNYKTLEYYYNSTCSDNVPVDSSDKQWIEFAFDAQTREFRSVSQYSQ